MVTEAVAAAAAAIHIRPTPPLRVLANRIIRCIVAAGSADEKLIKCCVQGRSEWQLTNNSHLLLLFALFVQWLLPVQSAQGCGEGAV